MKTDYTLVRQNYYYRNSVKYELLKAMRGREVAFIHREEVHKAIRGFFITNLHFLDLVFESYNILNEDYNIYISCAKYKYIPPFNMNLRERKKETSDWFEKKAVSQIETYNPVFDFDTRYLNKTTREWVYNRDRMLEEVLILSNYFYKRKLPFYIIPSGSNYQIVSLVDFTPEKAKTYIDYLKQELSLNHLDLASYGQPAKLMKCPYSLVGNTVCLPLKEVDLPILKNYNIFDCNYILRNIKIAYRGIPIIKW